MTSAFTYEQAGEICEDFEDLIDTELIIQTDRPIKCYVNRIIITPFDASAKTQFLLSPAEAQSMPQDETDNALYDVVIIASEMNDPSHVLIQYIRDYIAKNGVGYNFPD